MIGIPQSFQCATTTETIHKALFTSGMRYGHSSAGCQINVSTVDIRSRCDVLAGYYIITVAWCHLYDSSFENRKSRCAKPSVRETCQSNRPELLTNANRQRQISFSLRALTRLLPSQSETSWCIPGRMYTSCGVLLYTWSALECCTSLLCGTLPAIT